MNFIRYRFTLLGEP